jgi:cyclic pyranopterin monophosphate synthase
MVDVSEKEITLRIARAGGKILVSEKTVGRINDGTIPKGNVLAAAKLAGINAAKRTSEIVPLCHQLPLNSANVDFEIGDREISITSTVSCYGRTGVEMEALSAVSAAALTIYDMCKTIDKRMKITDIELLEKSGGKSGDYKKEDS